MKFNWNEMSAFQKIETIVLLVLALIALIFVILDQTGKWANNLHHLVLCAMCLFECYTGWNKNRKMAIWELVAAAFFAVYAFI